MLHDNGEEFFAGQLISRSGMILSNTNCFLVTPENNLHSTKSYPILRLTDPTKTQKNLKNLNTHKHKISKKNQNIKNPKIIYEQQRLVEIPFFQLKQ